MTYSILFSSHRLLKVLEWMALLAVALAFVRPYLGNSWFARIERGLGSLGRNRKRALLASALFPMIVRVVMLPWYPPPPPQIHDEFSYLLQADTFAHGRVANPQPPYWQHFETEYVLFQPSYASQYQPAQGLVLAFGQVIFGHPWWGVWVSMGVFCALLCWALQGFLPPVWAFTGALGAALQFGIFGLWMNSYFGGAVSGSAGAIILGALTRMKTGRHRALYGALVAFGIILLFSTRPFEGLLWSAISLPFLYRNRGTRLAALCIFFLGASTLAWYNWRVTGKALDPPYLAYQRVYGTPQPYWWQPPVRIASFRFPELRDNYLNQLHLYEMRHSLPDIFEAERKRLANFWRFFVGPFFTPALLFIGFLFRDIRMRPWLIASVPFIADKATYHAWYPAQNAPATILIVIVLLQCWRHMRAWKRRRGWGIAMSRTLVAATCLTIVLGNAGRALEPYIPDNMQHLKPIWESLYPRKLLRDEVNAYLEKIPGKHLLFVRYEPGHCFCEEWVFNNADLNQQKIVYARPFTPETDEALARSLADRDVWLAEPDAHPFTLTRLKGNEIARVAASTSEGE
jgi:hypothetical protein